MVGRRNEEDEIRGKEVLLNPKTREKNGSGKLKGLEKPVRHRAE
jgi:hypothetical protein